MSTKKKTILMNAFKVIKETPDKDLKKYGIEMVPYDGISDHDLLVKLAKKVDSIDELVKSDHQILLSLVREFKDFKCFVIDKFKQHKWID